MSSQQQIKVYLIDNQYNIKLINGIGTFGFRRVFVAS